MDKYEELLKASKEIWEESISRGGYVKKKEELPTTKSTNKQSLSKMRKTLS